MVLAAARKPVASGAGPNPRANARDVARADHRWIRFAEAVAEAGPTNQADAPARTAETASSTIWRPTPTVDRGRETGSTWPSRTGVRTPCQCHSKDTHPLWLRPSSWRRSPPWVRRRHCRRLHPHVRPWAPSSRPYPWFRQPTQLSLARERSLPRRAQRAWRDASATKEPPTHTVEGARGRVKAICRVRQAAPL